MKKIVLMLGVFIFSFGMIKQSKAECEAKENGYTNGSCRDTWNPGVSNNCGDGCTYDYNNGKLTVTATKPTAVIPEGIFSPSYYEAGIFPKISNVEIAGEFNTIGQHAFLYNNANISGKDGVLYLNNVSHHAFGGNTLSGTVIINDKQTSLGSGHLYSVLLGATVILPQNIKNVSAWVAYGLFLGNNAKIYCGAENCEQMFRDIDCNTLEEKYRNLCQSNLDALLSSGKLFSYPDGCTKMDATGCTKCKSSNFSLEYGYCYRKRYTLQEADEATSNDYENMIEWIFE